MTPHVDVLVIGAGVSGLTTACLLKKAGLRVEVVEARERLGGRILTQPNPLGGDPIELGAELVHGLPEETQMWLNPIEDLEERGGDFLIFENGKLTSSPSYFVKVSEVLERLSAPVSQDLSFQDWLDQIELEDPDLKEWVTGYIQGYHAADATEISVEALREIERESQEVDAVEGARFFRGGQGEFLRRIEREFAQPILLNHCVSEVHWSNLGVEVRFKSSKVPSIRAKKLVITVPIGVLQSSSGQEGYIEFHPELPQDFQQNLRLFKMGTAFRMSFIFKKAPWIIDPRLADFGMLLDPSPDALFRVWWKRGENQIIGWHGGPDPRLSISSSKEMLEELGVKSLSRLFGLSEIQIKADLEQTFVYNWNSDPYSRGVYPYIRVEGKSAVEKFSKPIENVLYFAGDAGSLGAYLGTINGAIKSGFRVSKEIIGLS